MDKLIGNLCDELKPVKRTRHPLICLTLWAIVSLAYVGGMILYLGLRHDMSERLLDPVFLFEIALVAILGIAAISCTFWLRIPDMRGAGWMIPVPLTLLGVYLLWMAIRIYTSHITMPEMEFHHCMQDGIMIAALPAVFMFLTVYRGCTTHPVLMTAMNALGIASVGYLALRLTCSSESIGHIFYTHLMPMIIVGVLVGYLARRFCRW